MINGAKHENKVIKEKGSKVQKWDVQQWFENLRTLLKVRKKVICLAYQQGNKVLKFKEREKFVNRVKDLGVRKSTIAFKINIVKLLNKYPKILKFITSFQKKYLKMIKEIAEKNASEFKEVTKKSV